MTSGINYQIQSRTLRALLPTSGKQFSYTGAPNRKTDGRYLAYGKVGTVTKDGTDGVTIFYSYDKIA